MEINHLPARASIYILCFHHIELSLSWTNQWNLDIRNSNFGALIGFEPKLINQTEHGTKLPNITNDIDVWTLIVI